MRAVGNILVPLVAVPASVISERGCSKRNSCLCCNSQIPIRSPSVNLGRRPSGRNFNILSPSVNPSRCPSRLNFNRRPGPLTKLSRSTHPRAA